MARERYDIELVVEDGFPTHLPENTGQELTRLVREAHTNVRRHAAADHVRVELGTGGGLAYVEVSDEGRGFDPDRARTGIGPAVHEPAPLELGGELAVESAQARAREYASPYPSPAWLKGSGAVPRPISVRPGQDKMMCSHRGQGLRKEGWPS